jgi:hypothetical protein
MRHIRSLIDKLTPTARRAVERAAGRCLADTHFEVTVEHLLLMMLDLANAGPDDAAPDRDITTAFERFGIDIGKVRAQLQAELDTLRRGNTRAPTLSPDIASLLTEAWLVASLDLKATQTSSGAILIATRSEAFAGRLGETVPELSRLAPDALIQLLSPDSPTPMAGAGTGPKVFLSYRRSDSETMAEILFWCLMAKVDGIRLFRDKDTLQPGMVFADVIDQNIAACDIVLVLIGQDWLGAQGRDGRPRLQADGDWVRLEIASALRQRKRIFPCLIDGAPMPSAEDLPMDLQGLAALNAASISMNDVGRDADRLVKAFGP